LLSESGIVVITLRHGPPRDEREMFEVTMNEVEELAKANNLKLFNGSSEYTEDALNRKSVKWETLVIGNSTYEQI